MASFEDIEIYQKRRVISIAIALMFLLFVGRLYQLQLIHQEEYGKKSEENSIRTIPREPVRGNIYDRNGTLVVGNQPAFTVTVMPFEFDTRNNGYLSSLLSIDPEFINDRLRKGIAHSRFVPVKMQRDIDFRTVSGLEEHRSQLPGVDYQVESKRHYVTRAHASHILGYMKEISESQLKNLGDTYTQGDVIGWCGLEAHYEAALRGQKGVELSLVNVRGQVIGSLDNGKHDTPPIDGNDLLLTMDFNLQALAESLMADRHGALVAVDPRDGGILAMVSKPDYSPQIFSGVTPPRLWRALNLDPSKQLFNRATMTRYPPGSTFKMVLAIAALEKEVVSPSWRVTCSGSLRFGNKIFKDIHAHGSVNMLEAIQRSCNVYFYHLMLKTGLDYWSEYGAKLGFGQNTGIDIAEENPGILPTTQWMNRRYGPNGWTQGFLPSLGIGQGEVGVTPIQMACYAAVIGSKGIYIKPHAVRGIYNKVAGKIQTVQYQSRTIDVSPSTWDLVREGLRRAVEEPGGTAGLARVRGIQVAGKTGTSQNPHGEDHAWFIGFAPYSDPKIAIAVMIENVGFGGSHAAPIAGMCFEKYLHGRVIRFDNRQSKTVAARERSSVSSTISQQTLPSDSLRAAMRND